MVLGGCRLARWAWGRVQGLWYWLDVGAHAAGIGTQDGVLSDGIGTTAAITEHVNGGGGDPPHGAAGDSMGTCPRIDPGGRLRLTWSHVGELS